MHLHEYVFQKPGYILCGRLRHSYDLTKHCIYAMDYFTFCSTLTEYIQTVIHIPLLLNCLLLDVVDGD